MATTPCVGMAGTTASGVPQTLHSASTLTSSESAPKVEFAELVSSHSLSVPNVLCCLVEDEIIGTGISIGLLLGSMQGEVAVPAVVRREAALGVFLDIERLGRFKSSTPLISASSKNSLSMHRLRGRFDRLASYQSARESIYVR